MMIRKRKKPSKSTTKHIKRKVMLLGDGAVGKTSLIRKFVTDKFDDKYITTIGTKVTKKELKLIDNETSIYLTLMIWDVLGQKGYKSIQATSLRGADGIIFVCDFTRKETLESLEEYWMANIGKDCSKLEMVFVANKSDLAKDCQFSLNELEQMASKYGSTCYTSSAKTGENVEKLFNSLGRMLLGVETKEESRAPMPIEGPPGELTLVDAADWIITDFCQSSGDMDWAMPIIRQQFTKAGVDIKAPTKEGLLKVIAFLEEVERNLRDEGTVRQNTRKRRRFLEQAKR